MFKKIILTLLFLVIVITGGVAYYISTVDWNLHKTKITQQIENLTGKKVVIDGKIDLTFFPVPHLKASNVKVFNAYNKNAQAPIAVIKEIVTDLRLTPLLKKQFVVDNLSLLEPKITIEFLPDGKTNWYSDIADNQKFTLSGVDIAFNSINIQNATVAVIDKAFGLDIVMNKTNADISAQSLTGPFRVDGNFEKDGTPAGFALNLGTLSETFATSLNLVLTHPSSESYARFDGSVLSNNSEIKGNFTVESKQPSVFVNTITGQNLLEEKYNYPLASSVELTVNPKQIDLSSFIIKHGDFTAGAGRVLIPLVADKNDGREVEISFEMTDLDLMPFISLAQKYIEKYDNKKTPFNPALDYNLKADISSVRATLNNQPVRNFKFGADIINNVLTVKELSGTLAGDTSISLRGDVFENEKLLSYDFSVKGSSEDFLKFLNLWNINPKTYAQSTYKNAQFNFGLSGNLNQIRVTPFQLIVDNIETGGSIGIKRDRKNSYFVMLSAQSVNFDNYLPTIAEKSENLSFSEQVKRFINTFKFLNDVDIQTDLTINFGIYQKTPFEDLNIKLVSKNGQVDIQALNIEKILASKLNLSGQIESLGTNPSYKNLKFDILSSDIQQIFQKLNIATPEWPLIKSAHTLELKGISSGTFTASNNKIVAQLGKLNTIYQGKIFAQETGTYYRGDLALKTTDFTSLINGLGLDYRSKALSSGIFTFDGKVEGTAQKWRATDIDAFIGANNFTGALAVEQKKEHPSITANLTANVFEFGRFIDLTDISKKASKKTKETHTFIQKPVFSDAVICYDKLKNVDFKGKFATKIFTINQEEFSDLSVYIELINNKLSLQNLKMFDSDKAEFTANAEIDIVQNPFIKGNLEIKGLKVNKIGGSIYALQSGTLDLKANFEAPATSEKDFMEGLTGHISFDISKTTLKGMDLDIIADDLAQRTTSDNLEKVLKQALQNGETNLNLIGGEIEIKDQKYTIKDAVAAATGASINIEGEGNVAEWNTNTHFSLTVDQLKDQIPPVIFSMTGSIADPELNVDAVNLKNKYDSYWQKVKEEKDLQEAAQKKALADSMAQTQEKVSKLQKTLSSEIFPRLDRYTPLSINGDIKAAYDSVNIQATDISKELNAMHTKSLLEYTKEDIQNMDIRLETYDNPLLEMISRLDETFTYDLKMHAADSYKKIVGIYQNSNDKSKNYQSTLNAYALRLMQMGSLVVLDTVDVVKKDKKSIQDTLFDISDAYREAGNLKSEIEKTENLPVLEKLNSDMSQLADKTKVSFEKLDAALEDLFLYLKDIVYFEEHGEHLPKTEIAPQPKNKSTSKEETSVKQEDTQTEKKDVITEEQPEETAKAEETPIIPEPVFKKIEENQPVPEESDVAETKEIIPTTQDDPKEEAITFEPTEETSQDVTLKEAVQEVLSQPLLREKTSEYQSKAISGGVITKKGAEISAQENIQTTDQPPLLKQSEGKVTLQGTITKK